jgi:hypothetical protein
MRRHLAFAAVIASLSSPVDAQDKRLEAVCGNLFGARQTAIRLMQEGWPGNVIVQQTLERPEWRNVSMQDQKMLMDLLQETFDNPRSPSSAVIRDCMRRAENAPKSQ